MGKQGEKYNVKRYEWKNSKKVVVTIDFKDGKAIKKSMLLFSLALFLIPGQGADQNSARGTKIRIQSPLPNERFIKNESMTFRAILTSDQSLDGKALQWLSNHDGLLGTGPAIRIHKLSPGNHQVSLLGYGIRQTVNIRVFNDLWDLYQASPAPAEIERITKDFSFNWTSLKGNDEQWEAYRKVGFNQSSTDPSKLVAYAKLDVLRHQQFAEPLPFTHGKTIYGHLRTFVKKLYLRLSCDQNTGGGGTINLDRNFSVWDLRQSGTAQQPDACKSPFPNHQLGSYVHALYLFVHEGRHNEPGHIDCSGKGNMDASLEGGSGHAAAALYLMWVYKYGLYDPPSIKEEAKIIARSLLKSRFCSTPTHSNPKVQAILDEILQ